MVALRYEICLRVFNSISHEPSELSERVRYRDEHEKRNFIHPSNHVLFCSFYKPAYNEVFDDFPKISRHFPKISKCFPVVIRMFPNIFQTFPKIPEDCRGRSEDVST